MKAYVFPGQGAQFAGMAKTLEAHPDAHRYFSLAGEILGFDIYDVMLNGTDEDLRQTSITQPAIFLHSVISSFVANDFHPSAVAGHSLGEFSALVASKAMKFEDGLRLISIRALAMQHACDTYPGTMAAIIGMEDEVIEKVCKEVEGIVVPANYNSPGQLVISGEHDAIDQAVVVLKGLGCRNAVKLPVGGAFHSPLMALAEQELEKGITSTVITMPVCPVYQNIDALPTIDPGQIKINLLRQLTGPVRWGQTIQNMIKDGMTEFVEVGGNGKVLSGLIKKIDRKIPVSNI